MRPAMLRSALFLACVTFLSVGCGDDAPRGAPPPRDPPTAAPPPTESAATPAEPPTTHAQAGTGDDPTGSDPTGSDPTGSDPTGSAPTGIDPAEPAPPVDPEHPERSFRVRPEQERSFEAYACLGRRDYACIERLLGDGGAQTPGEMSILIRAQRAQHEDSSACASMQSLFDRFPESTETARYRAIHYQTCPR